ncbi:hypothetical protein GJ496_010599 [Pomphorhynchus laevis]|nr:hypothetical protein GJ496_010599 [Pomphorhynchus laevis]
MKNQRDNYNTTLISNISKKELTANQISAISLGLNSNVTPSEFNRLEWAGCLAKSAKSFLSGEGKVEATNNAGQALYDKYIIIPPNQTGKLNIKKTYLKAIKEISKMDDVVLKQADKGKKPLFGLKRTT